MNVYRVLFQRVFVHADPEAAHRWSFLLIRAAGRVPPVRWLIRGVIRAAEGKPAVAVRALGRDFPGVLGLAAGFDKNAQGIPGLTMLGFSHIEVGTVTARAQPGNPPPRLWRVLDSRGLRNRMGFNNQGAARVARRLARVRRTRAGRAGIVGVNIGKSKLTPPERAAADYRTSARLLAPHADYVVVNVSSPNTPGLRDLQAVPALRPILAAAREGADLGSPGRRVPLLVKIAPDLADGEIDAIASLALELGLDGVVAVNTTVDHRLGEGGLSGPPLLARGLQVVAHLRERLGPDAVVIGVGGISSASDAAAYLAAGATLVQAYTAFIYEGPFWPARVNAGSGLG
ncbi:MAG: quinone-dependent dihydroorotate dehydrogenase [Bifidobacteriaceae bacterium]|nr:quinone-dependent dihydroorotate dehydrogenase [Bifidobacteriaceae bacterium]